MSDILEEIDALSAKTIDEDEDWMEMAHASYTLLIKARAEIAALREARDALAGDGARDDGARIDATVLPHSEYGEWNQQLEAQRYGAPASAAPSRATDAAPERAATRLTRAQREALEQIIDHGGWLPKYRISGEAPAFRDIRNSQLANREFGYDMEGYAITDAGRAALAAAQRETDDARDASEEA